MPTNVLEPITPVETPVAVSLPERGTPVQAAHILQTLIARRREDAEEGNSSEGAQEEWSYGEARRELSRYVAENVVTEEGRRGTLALFVHDLEAQIVEGMDEGLRSQIEFLITYVEKRVCVWDYMHHVGRDFDQAGQYLQRLRELTGMTEERAERFIERYRTAVERYAAPEGVQSEDILEEPEERQEDEAEESPLQYHPVVKLDLAIRKGEAQTVLQLYYDLLSRKEPIGESYRIQIFLLCLNQPDSMPLVSELYKNDEAARPLIVQHFIPRFDDLRLLYQQVAQDEGLEADMVHRLEEETVSRLRGSVSSQAA